MVTPTKGMKGTEGQPHKTAIGGFDELSAVIFMKAESPKIPLP